MTSLVSNHFPFNLILSLGNSQKSHGAQLGTHFLMFPKLKMTLKDKRFETNEDIKANTTNCSKLLNKEDFQTCVRQWQGSWNKCVCAEGEYFVDDKSQNLIISAI